MIKALEHTSRRAMLLAKETLSFPHPERAILRWAAFAAARPFTGTLSTTVDGIKYHVSTRDRAIGRVLYMGRVPDGDLLTSYFDIISDEIGRPAVKGTTCLEIGANIGTTTLPVLLQHGAERCVVLEPAPDNLSLLRANLAANGVGPDRVRVLPVAASERPGIVEFELSGANSGDHRVRHQDGPGAKEPELYGETKRPVISVKAARIDDILAEQAISLNDIGLTWIDTQGHEGHVLAGAHRLLASGAPVIMEYWPYGLRRAGGLDLLHWLIRDSGRRVVDLRETLNHGSAHSLSRPELESLPTRYPNGQFTDLALLA